MRGLPDEDLTFLEFFPILVAIYLWGEDMRDSNLAVVHTINTLTSKSRRVMGLVRAFTLCCLRLNMLFLARHVPGLDNRVTDIFSHKQMQRFRHLDPEVDLCSVQLPEEVWSPGE